VANGRSARKARRLVVTLCALAIGAFAGQAHAATTCFGLEPTIIGTDGDDRISGTPSRDVIVGKLGNDHILGRGGNDLICAGRGQDVVKGYTGDDKIAGGQGSDTLIGGRGDDSLFGSEGGDFIDGREGNDTVRGGKHRDALFDSVGSDKILGQMGRDTLHVVLDRANDVFSGGPGRRDLILLPGFSSGGRTKPMTVDLTTGEATGAGDDALSRFENVTGGIAGDTVIGNSQPNRLFGGSHIEGRGGDDFLIGTDGPGDFLDGGDGTDRCEKGEVVLNCEA
jgi:Ca2+-binding RTX toxin-like protein